MIRHLVLIFRLQFIIFLFHPLHMIPSTAARDREWNGMEWSGVEWARELGLFFIPQELLDLGF